MTLVEFEERTARAYAAKTSGELDALAVDLPFMTRGNRQDRRPERLGLSLLALAGGVGWMPLYPEVHPVALPGAAGVVFGLLGSRANGHIFCRLLAILGLVGGSVCLALQAAWVIYHVLD